MVVETPQATILLKQGIAAAKAGDKFRAKELLRYSVGADPRNEFAWLWLASLAESPMEAIEFLSRAHQINPANDRTRTSLSNARMNAAANAANSGQREQARRLFQLVCQDEPNNDTALVWLAGVTDQAAEAVGYLERALAINPANPHAKTGLQQLRANRPVAPQPAAQQTAQLAATTYPCPLCGHRSELKGHVCPGCGAVLNLQNLQAALNNPNVKPDLIRAGAARLSAAANAKPDFSVLYYLGMALLNLGRPDEALNHFRAAQKFRPMDTAYAAQLSAFEQVRAPAAKRPAMTAPTVSAPVLPPTLMPRKLNGIASTPANPPESGNKTVLVIDDSPTIRKLVSMTLTKNGYRSVEAGDGQEALDRIRESGIPDLVLLDIAMPRMDGYELCKILRSRNDTAKIPIIMLSGKDGFFNKMRGKMAGSTLYLTKPFQPDALLKVIRKYAPSELESVPV